MSTHQQLEEQQRRLALFEDRERIGMELHDGAIQSLYAVGLGLESVTQVLERSPAIARERLLHAREQVNAIMREIRNYIVDLRGDTFEKHGLQTGLAALTRDLEINTLIDVELDIAQGVDAAFSRDRAEAVFQIVREALANVARHASATRVEVRLHQPGDHWVLRVVDNGVGIDPVRTSEAGFGLRNMHERARRMNGALTVRRLPEGGTEVNLLVASDVGQVAA
jgi:signal transduction histidine kinase